MTVATFHSTVTQKGQVTIPVRIRKKLGIRSKTKVTFEMDNDGNIRLEKPLKSVREVFEESKPKNKISVEKAIEMAKKEKDEMYAKKYGIS